MWQMEYCFILYAFSLTNLTSGFEYLKKKSSSSVSAMVVGNVLLFIWKHSSEKLRMLEIGQVSLK